MFEELANWTIDLIILKNYEIWSLTPKNQKYKCVLSLFKVVMLLVKKKHKKWLRDKIIIFLMTNSIIILKNNLKMILKAV